MHKCKERGEGRWWGGVEEKRRGWISWMAAVRGGSRLIKVRGVYVWHADRFWSVEELVPEGRVSERETVRRRAALSREEMIGVD